MQTCTHTQTWMICQGRTSLEDVSTAARTDSFIGTLSLLTPPLTFHCLLPPLFLVFLSFMCLYVNLEQKRGYCICWIDVKCCSLATPLLTATGWIMLFYWTEGLHRILWSSTNYLRACEILLKTALHSNHPQLPLNKLKKSLFFSSS